MTHTPPATSPKPPTPRAHTRARILLLGAYGRKNIGDDIFLKILLDTFSEFAIDYNCWDTDNLPPEIASQPHHRAVPTSARSVFSVLRALMQARVVVYGGGELWMRLDGTRYPNASTLKMIIVNLAARLLRKDVYYLSVGSEPLTGWSLLLAKTSARLATHVSFRDNESARILGLPPEKTSVAPDIAFTYTPPLIDARMHTDGTPVVGISAVKLSNTQDSVNTKNIQDLAAVLKTSYPHATFKLFLAMSDERAHESDLKLAQELQQLLGSAAAIHSYHSIDTFVRELSVCDVVVSYRLHVNILAHLIGVPVVGIGYKPKIKKFFEAYSNPQLYCSPDRISTDLQPALAQVNALNPSIRSSTEQAVTQANAHYTNLYTTLKHS